MDNSIDEFERLMLDYLKGTIVPADMQKLVSLLKDDPSCRERYREMSQAYGMASTLRFEEKKRANFDQLRNRLNFRSSRNTLTRRMRIWGNAAIWALLIISGITFLYFHNDSTKSASLASYCQIEIPQGATSKLLLPDSTLVYLNGGTIIKYDASFQNKTKREVFLTGEAYFKVTANVEKPFIVHTEDLNIKVLGTAFNVTSYPDAPDIKVSLVKGSVNVFTISERKGNVILSPDEQAVYDKQQGQLSVNRIDAASQAAWTTGRLVFVNERLCDILKAVGKKYDVQIQVQSQKVQTEFFSGSIDSALSLDEIFSYIDVDNKFIWKRKGKTIVITDR